VFTDLQAEGEDLFRPEIQTCFSFAQAEAMPYPTSTVVLLGIFLGLTLLFLGCALTRRRLALGSYVNYTWIFFLSFAAAEVVSFPAGIWILGLLCFWALREYFSLIDIRLQDRLGILGAYLSIPFMIYFIQIDWYGMFIISIPVYGFLAIPLLVTLGGKEAQGTVFSVGAIDFGLFLFVYCLGHIGYLMRLSPWMAALMILSVALCDGAARLVLKRRKRDWAGLLLLYVLPLPFVAATAWLLSPWTGIPTGHSFALAALIPMLVILGQHTIGYVKADLGVQNESPAPGQGQILDHLQSLFFVAPIMFHYIWYFLT
jgi:phosphatidate cytidylyltransferase